jgi:hypothetical protein
LALVAARSCCPSPPPRSSSFDDGGTSDAASPSDHRIDVVLAAGADVGTVSAAIDAARLAQPYVLSVPGDVAASLRASTTDIRSIMALLAGITMFASAFLILNTLAMTVVERIRELALLRAAGAGRAQVMRVVLAQALLLGAAGPRAWSRVGWHACGRLAGCGRRIDGPEATPQVPGGFAAGPAIVVAALELARRAAAISPVAALRSRADSMAAVRARARWLVAVAVAVGVVGCCCPDGSASRSDAFARPASATAGCRAADAGSPGAPAITGLLFRLSFASRSGWPGPPSPGTGAAPPSPLARWSWAWRWSSRWAPSPRTPAPHPPPGWPTSCPVTRS